MRREQGGRKKCTRCQRSSPWLFNLYVRRTPKDYQRLATFRRGVPRPCPASLPLSLTESHSLIKNPRWLLAAISVLPFPFGFCCQRTHARPYRRHLLAPCPPHCINIVVQPRRPRHAESTRPSVSFLSPFSHLLTVVFSAKCR